MYVIMDVVKLISFIASACTADSLAFTLLDHFKFYHISITNEGGGGQQRFTATQNKLQVHYKSTMI